LQKTNILDARKILKIIIDPNNTRIHWKKYNIDFKAEVERFSHTLDKNPIKRTGINGKITINNVCDAFFEYLKTSRTIDPKAADKIRSSTMDAIKGQLTKPAVRSALAAIVARFKKVT
jgi:hypothetical protein